MRATAPSLIVLTPLLALLAGCSPAPPGAAPPASEGVVAPPASAAESASALESASAVESAGAVESASAVESPGAEPAAQPAAGDSGSPWQVDFFDDFERFDPANWQDQLLWVNNEDQCYVRDGAYGTREVSGGTLKLRVVDLGEPRPCDNVGKAGERHPDTAFVAGRIASKNRQEFALGRWTARLRVRGSGQPGMFPAWWLLGARNNEPPVQEADENVCWPMPGSGEIDVFEHHSDGGPDHYAARNIVSGGECGAGDWQSRMLVQAAPLGEWHEYSVEWQGGDLVFRLDGVENYRAEGQGALLQEPFFAILNFAKIKPGPMTSSWEMEVDWVKHERRDPVAAPPPPAADPPGP